MHRTPKKPRTGGDPNETYNEGLRLMRSIERDLRDGDLDAEGRKVAEQAEARFLAALELAPDHGRALVMLGMLYRFTGRFDDAVAPLEAALGLPRDCDDWTKAVDTLAAVHMQSGRHRKAVKLLEDALKDHADDPYLVLKLAACHDALGKPKEAIRVLEAGLKAAPGDPRLSAGLAEMREKSAPAVTPTPALPPEAQALQAKAMKLGEALQKTMESIMNGPGSGAEKAKRVADAQAEYQAAVMKLYRP